jgi:dUTP pyrophosphatase
METLKVKVLENGKDLPIFKYQTEGSAGLDIYAAEDSEIKGISYTHFYNEEHKRLEPSIKIDQVGVKTGIAIEIPKGYFGQVCSRSGLAVKNKIDCGITPGIIDSDYRGELIVCLRNYSDVNFKIKRGDRIAQLLILPYKQVNIEVVEELSDTVRGSGGFGSTGIK